MVFLSQFFGHNGCSKFFFRSPFLSQYLDLITRCASLEQLMGAISHFFFVFFLKIEHFHDDDDDDDYFKIMFHFFLSVSVS